MPLEARKYLYDIKQAADLLGEFTAGKQFSDYKENSMLRAAVERKFEIIGEALSKLSKADSAIACPHGTVPTGDPTTIRIHSSGRCFCA